MTRGPHPLRLSVLLAVAIGAAAGAVLRQALSSLGDAGWFPWGTLAVNVSGCFALALLPAWARVRTHPLLPPLLGTGVLGGFTTMSTWSDQTRVLVSSGRVTAAAMYVIGTLAACLVAVAVADRFSTARQRAQFEEEEGDL